MKALLFLVLSAISFSARPASRAAAADEKPASRPDQPAKPAPLKVTVFSEDWKDSARSRDIPVRIYMPEGAGPFPLIVFSHGLGGVRDAYPFLGNSWAAAGFVCVHPQHAGSDMASFFGKGRTSLLKAAADRPADVKFIIDEVLRRNTDGAAAWKGKIDPAKIGVGGHSFGAHTAMAIAGAQYPAMSSAADPRVKAVIAMSTPVMGGKLLIGHTYDKITIPVFHMTGTKDDSPVGETTAANRRLPYDYTKTAESLLLNLKDANHMVFCGPMAFINNHAKQKRWEALIQESTLAFWKAHLLGDTAARDWLNGGGFQKSLGDDGTFERKAP